MKIFISHSSKDKWAAQTIAKDLAEMDVETFLDEKDIETGEEIDASIQALLTECDDFLVLLSPASIQSHWVLVELGGAIALKKRLVPVLFYIGTNELPAPITKHLSRDINDIDRYYEEIKRRLEGETVEPTAPLKPKRRPKPREDFSVGDRVKITDTPLPTASRKTPNITWKNEMDLYCGKVGIIQEIDRDRSLKLDVDGGDWWWAFEWLTADD